MKAIVAGVAAVVLLFPALVSASDADLRELTAYRLSTAGLDKYIATNRALVEAMRNDPHIQELGRVSTEIAELEDAGDWTEESERRLDALYQRQEELEGMLEGLSLQDGSLDELDANVRRHPLMSAAVRRGGFTPREYVVFTLALVQAGMTVAMQEAGLQDQAAGAPAENVRFVHEHRARLEAMKHEFAALELGR